MNLLEAILGVLVLALAGISAYFLFERARLAALAAEARARADALTADAARAAELHAQALAAATQARARLEDDLAVRAREVQDLRVRESELRSSLTAAAQQHELQLRQQETLLKERVAAVEAQRQQSEKQVREELAALHQRFTAAFGALAADSLKEANKEFVRLAAETFKQQQQAGAGEIDKRREAIENLLKPVHDVLARTDQKLNEIERERTGAYAGLVEQVKQLGAGSETLRQETRKLVQALREPHVRGRYGELQLKRVAELAGMTAYCDFCTQESTRDSDGTLQRPDMIVRLPSSRVVYVDAKTNIQAYLDALQTDEPARQEECLDRFARHVSEQVAALARKKYWALDEGSPEFVVMFIPGDHFIDAALARAPDLLDHAFRQNVILASPSTLIGLLRAVAVGYKEERLAREAAELRALGRELHERASVAFDHVVKLGDTLDKAARHYNNFVGSYQSRLEPTLRKFEEAGVKSGKDVPALEVVATQPRLLPSAEIAP